MRFVVNVKTGAFCSRRDYYLRPSFTSAERNNVSAGEAPPPRGCLHFHINLLLYGKAVSAGGPVHVGTLNPVHVDTN